VASVSEVSEGVIDAGTVQGQLLFLADAQTQLHVGDTIPAKQGPTWNDTNLRRWREDHFATINSFIPVPRQAKLAIVAEYRTAHRDPAHLARASFMLLGMDDRIDVAAAHSPELYEDDLCRHILERVIATAMSVPRQVAVQAYRSVPPEQPEWRFDHAKDRRIHARSGYFTQKAS
jgi:hypothetical protein